MNPIHDFKNLATRRTLLGATTGAAIGRTALSALLTRVALATITLAPSSAGGSKSERDLPGLPHFTPKPNESSASSKAKASPTSISSTTNPPLHATVGNVSTQMGTSK
jgi:hypothetical protein